jgi:hypothetical protein
LKYNPGRRRAHAQAITSSVRSFRLASTVFLALLITTLIFSATAGAEDKKPPESAAVSLHPDGQRLSLRASPPVATLLLGQFRTLVKPSIPMPVQSRDGVVVDQWSWLALSLGALLVGGGLAIHLSSKEIAETIGSRRDNDGSRAMMNVGLRHVDDVLARPSVINAIALAVGAVGGASLMTGVALTLQPTGASTVVKPHVGRTRALLRMSLTF